MIAGRGPVTGAPREADMSKPVRWGIVGLGSIANRVMKGLKVTPPEETQVVAVGSRDAEKAEAFAAQFGIRQSHGSYDGVINNPNVDLVYVALPNHLHVPVAIKALKAGKHVLCEKPFAMTEAEAKPAFAAAKKAKRFLMEAFMYRCHPQMHRIREIVLKELGEVRMVRAAFAYGGINEDNTRMKNAEGGGGLMDVGSYPVSFIRFVTGQEPVELKASAVIGRKSGVDHWCAGVMKFPSGAIGYFDAGMMVTTDWTATIWGTKGKLHVTNPWIPEPPSTELHLTRYAESRTEKIIVQAKHYFANEADAVSRAINAGKLEAPEMRWADTLGNLKALDGLRKSMGLVWKKK